MFSGVRNNQLRGRESFWQLPAGLTVLHDRWAFLPVLVISWLFRLFSGFDWDLPAVSVIFREVRWFQDRMEGIFVWQK